MPGSIVIGWFSPHPPIIIPAVGRGEELKAQATSAGMQQAAEQVTEARPDVLVIFGPHGPVFDDAFTIESPGELSGSFAAFGAPEEQISVKVHAALTGMIMQRAEEAGLPLYGLTKQLKQRFHHPHELDHGLAVPLWFLSQAAPDGLPAAVIINVSGLPLEDHYQLGMIIQAALAQAGLRAAVIGSGDLSHRLSQGAPSGYHPSAHLFDETAQEVFRGQNPEGLSKLADLAGCAGECGLRPLAVFLGCFDGLAGEGQVLSYQAPFGVGYLVGMRRVEGESGHHYLDQLHQARASRLAVQRERETPPVRLARLTVESLITGGKLPDGRLESSSQLPEQAGTFVSIKKHGQLRGCIGTTGPTQPTLGLEIVQNAISAATKDPRFDPIEESELALLTYSVDVLGSPQPISDQFSLDPKIYGVIVQAGGRQGLLLPDLPGVDSITEQVDIARKKAGIRLGESVKLSRFTVTRFQ